MVTWCKPMRFRLLMISDIFLLRSYLTGVVYRRGTFNYTYNASFNRP